MPAHTPPGSETARHAQGWPLPPVAPVRPHEHVLHGDRRADPYYWLRERDNPDVVAYLEAENAYLAAVMEPLTPLADQLYAELLSRLEETKVEAAVPCRGFFYYSRTEQGKPYRIFARKEAATRAALATAPETVVLDLNAMAEGSAYYHVTMTRVSPDQTRVAYLDNRDGTDRYVLHIKDLRTGNLLPDTVSPVFLHGSLEWAGDGQHVFYVTVDDTQRPYRLWRHQVGGPEADTLLYQEDDPTFSLRLSKTASGRHLLLSAVNKATDEVRWLAADDPLGAWRLFRPRETGIRYSLEDWGDHFLILTNQQRDNYQVLTTPLRAPDWETALPIWPDDPAIYVTRVHPFQEALLLEGRQAGLTEIWVYRDGAARRLRWDEPLYTVSVAANLDYETPCPLVHYESFLTPRLTAEVDLVTLDLETVQQDRVPGPFARDAYVQERLWVRAEDGAEIPVCLVQRRDVVRPAPLLLRGYGSYGAPSDPRFRANLLPLLDRGVTVAIAQVRGGSEMGDRWYQDGKWLRKRHTFTDFVDAARSLVAKGYTTPDRLGAEGRSAGGLLMGAVMNLAPSLFAVVLAGVPFVDVVTTMLDASIPLTSLEWDEWGNPQDPTYYAYMKSYSPYDNVRADTYPHCFVSTGLNDPRVGYWEPAKWVARLRALKTDEHTLVLRTHMGAGHGGSSDRYQHLRDEAQELAFLLDKLGLSE